MFGVSTAVQCEEPDFRDVTWGMSRLEVMTHEDMSPVSLEAPYIYYRSRIAGEEHHLIYGFIEDKLVNAVYIIVTRPPNAYLKFKKKIEKKYGPADRAYNKGGRNYLYRWNKKLTEITIRPGFIRECRIEYLSKQYKYLITKKEKERKERLLEELLRSY